MRAIPKSAPGGSAGRRSTAPVLFAGRRAIAEALAAEGARVVISGRSAQRGTQVVGGIRSRGGRAHFVMAELDESAEASRSLVAKASSILGGHIDILVNNAGIYPGDNTAATDEKTFDRVYAVNVKAPFPDRGDHDPRLSPEEIRVAAERWG
jgi:short-subunit dehydrogenase involved in D-alanine esterification of teichoic acids